MAETYLFVAAVAKALNVTGSAVTLYCRKGFLPGAMKCGSSRTAAWVIPQSAVDSFKTQYDVCEK